MNEIEVAVKQSGGWTALETKIKGKASRNFKRTVFNLIEKLNGWLKEIGLQLTVKKLENDNSGTPKIN